MGPLEDFLDFGNGELTSESFTIKKRKKRNKSDIIYQLIRQGVILGKWKPGDRLHDNELAELFGCSRNSVREALSNLIRLHIVEKEHYWKGYRVRIPDWEEIVEAIDLRASLDYVAFEKLIKIKGDRFGRIMAQLKSHLDKAEIIIANEPDKKRQAAVDFFHLIYNAVSDYLLVDVIDNISAIPELLSYAIHSEYPDMAKESHLWQVKIYNELKNRNLTGSIGMLQKHIEEYKEIAAKAYSGISPS